MPASLHPAPAKKKVLAICGSTRARSSNLSLIRAIAGLTQQQLDIIIYTDLAKLPQFNPDEDTDSPAAEVTDFRRQVRETDGVLICTPEYAMGVPGSLKNALDWTVSSAEFSHKPLALITASSVGQKGHAALLETLKVIECKLHPETQLVISFVKTKVADPDKIIHAETLDAVQKLLTCFVQQLNA